MAKISEVGEEIPDVGVFQFRLISLGYPIADANGLQKNTGAILIKEKLPYISLSYQSGFLLHFWQMPFII